MSKKQVLILWIIAALLGVSVAAVRVSQSKGPIDVTKFARGTKLFQDVPVRELTTISIKDVEQTTTLTKGDAGWLVSERGDYPVNMNMLVGLLDKFNDVKVGHGLEAGATYNNRFGMDTEATESKDHGLLLTLTAPGKDPWTVSLGKSTEGQFDMANPMAPRTGGGRYVRISTDPESVYVLEESFPRVTADPKDWLSEDFLQIQGLQSVTLRAPGDNGFEPWTLSRENETADFTLAGISEQEEIITTVVDPLKNLFSYARFEDVLTEEAAKEMRDEEQARQATITTFDGFTYTVDVAPKIAEEGTEEEPASNPSHLLSVSVTAKLPEKRTPAADEKEEDKAARDAAFAIQQETLREKLTMEQKLNSRVFLVTKWTVDSLLKTRADFVRPKEVIEPPAPAPAPKLEDAFGLPSR